MLAKLAKLQASTKIVLVLHFVSVALVYAEIGGMVAMLLAGFTVMLLCIRALLALVYDDDEPIASQIHGSLDELRIGAAKGVSEFPDKHR